MYPLFKPYIPKLPKLKKVLRSGQLTYGSYTKGFERALSVFFDNEKVIALNSFSSAIDVVIKCLELKSGDEIVMSPMACLSSTMPFLARNLKIVWADIDPARGTLDPRSVEKKITKRTKLIVHNHFCGYPGYIDEINEIGHRNGILVVDDCIESFGSTYKGKVLGNCGSDISIFSLSAVRIPNTIDGGIVVFRDASYYKKSLLIRDLNINRDEFRKTNGEINENYDINDIGYSAMMSNVNGYIGLEQMKHLGRLIKQQRENAKRWENKLSRTEEVSIITAEDAIPNYWVFGILVNDKESAIKRFRDMGFYASGVHINNNIYSIFKDNSTLPGVEEFNRHFIALPCGWWMKNKI